MMAEGSASAIPRAEGQHAQNFKTQIRQRADVPKSMADDSDVSNAVISKILPGMRLRSDKLQGVCGRVPRNSVRLNFCCGWPFELESGNRINVTYGHHFPGIGSGEVECCAGIA